MTEKTVSMKEIKEYLSKGGHREVANSELLDLKKDDPEGFEEIKKLVGEELNKESKK